MTTDELRPKTRRTIQRTALNTGPGRPLVEDPLGSAADLRPISSGGVKRHQPREADLWVQSRLWPKNTPDPVRRLRIAGLKAFSELGFSGATTRQIASLARMSPAALYSHYASKADLLFDISHAAHEYALRDLQREFVVEGTAIDRVRRLATTFTQYHASFHTATRIAQYELHSLAPDHFTIIVELRRAIHTIMREAIRLGCVEGDLAVDDLDSTTTFVLSLGIDVARWFRPEGRLSPEEIGAQCSDLVIRMLRRVPTTTQER